MKSTTIITKISSILLVLLFLCAVTNPVSAEYIIPKDKDKNNLDIPNYFLPIKNFDMMPYLHSKSISDISLLKYCFRDDTCWNSLDTKTQSDIYKLRDRSKLPYIQEPVDKTRDEICSRHHYCNLDKKGWVGTETPTEGNLHLSYDNTQSSKISIKMSYEPKKIKLYDRIYQFERNNKPNEMIFLDKTFDLKNISDSELNAILLIVKIIDTGSRNDLGSLILTLAVTSGGVVGTIVTCAGAILSFGVLTPACSFSVVVSSVGVKVTLDYVNDYIQNEKTVNTYMEQLKSYNDINIKEDL